MNGKTALVTGAGNGIGRSCALLLAKKGARVLALDLHPERVQAVAGEIHATGGTCRALRADITKADEVGSAVADGIAHFGHIDILVNCAGGGWRKQSDFKDMPENEWQWVVDLNIHGTLRCTRAVLPHMVERRSGRIINIASIAAHAGIPRLAVYSATKGAILSFTKALAMEVGPYDITVNSVSPGLIANGAEPVASDGTFLGRKGTPEEVAAVVAFLASEEAAYVTGTDCRVDGGRVLGPRGA